MPANPTSTHIDDFLHKWEAQDMQQRKITRSNPEELAEMHNSSFIRNQSS
jgi:hypothetical protein